MSSEILKIPLSKAVFLSCLSFVLGILFSPFIPLSFLLGIFLFFFKEVRIVGLILFLLAFGSLYQEVAFNQTYLLPSFSGKEIDFKGKVVEEDRNVVLIEEIVSEKEKISIEEKAIFYLEGDLSYGEVIKGSGTPVTADKDFRNYLKTDRISTIFYRPEISVIGNFSDIKGKIFSLRRFFQSKIEEGLLPPQSGVLKAILLGDRSEISDSWREKFSKVGVGHMLAVSGMHIVIVSGLIIAFLKGIKIKRGKYLLSIVLLILFIILVGAPPSAIRAGIMGSLFIISKMIGRRKSSIRLLLFAATLMLIFNPLLLKYSLAFQLSFLAALGIILFTPKLNYFFSKLIPHRFSLVKETLSTTLSAQVFALPLIYISFGYFPLLAPVSNLFIAPLLPALMILGIISAFLSIFIPPVIAFGFINFFITLLLSIVELFGILIGV